MFYETEILFLYYVVALIAHYKQWPLRVSVISIIFVKIDIIVLSIVQHSVLEHIDWIYYLPCTCTVTREYSGFKTLWLSFERNYAVLDKTCFHKSQAIFVGSKIYMCQPLKMYDAHIKTRVFQIKRNPVFNLITFRNKQR